MQETFVETLVYFDFKELHSDDQLLETMFYIGVYFPRVIKEIGVNDDGFLMSC